ncbi:protein kinase domain-containing protein [Neorhodopirellula pilleata]|uniref:Serine/threonine-protein kinase PknB n=1 Tax=Neorhodopirellula pilleata TaxID=2714738 RepID=A0A5C5ZYX6_9BACT|nr:protein kinase [Neorhodopirellula pilleata]TWT92479.1 Serine/threonine-protein kinase PknB [Neorhodopirellula pilleata]
MDTLNRQPASLWGAPLCPSQSQTQFLGDIVDGTRTEAPLPFDMGEYSVTRLIGRGGMGVVFEGEHRRMQRRVAIKVLHANMAEAESAQEQFLAEIRTVARLLHPRIVTAFDAGQYETIVYLVMEYVDGHSLDRLSTPGAPMGLADALECVQFAAEGLAHAHLNNIIHRDVKPGNMMLAHDGELKILDLGLAAFSHELIDDEQGGKRRPICGTPEFMAPEQFEGRDLTESIDVYALGCTLHQLLTGSPPFRGSFFELMRAHCGTPPPQLSAIESLASEPVIADVQALMNEMMGKQIHDRCASMNEVVERLTRIRGRLLNTSGNHATRSSTHVVSSSPIVSQTLGGFSTSDARDGTAETREITSCYQVGIDLGGHQLTAGGFGEGLQSDDLALPSGPTAVTIALDDNSSSIDACFAVSQSQGWAIGQAALVRLANGRAGCGNAISLIAKQPSLSIDGKEYPSSMPLACLFRRAFQRSAMVGPANSVFEASLTVPSSFGRAARERIMLAARACGVPSIHLIDRNLASALSQFTFRADGEGSAPRLPAGHWLVVTINDLVMEISLLAVTSGRIKMLSVVGDSRSNRHRFSRRMLKWVKKRVAKMGQSSSGGSITSGQPLKTQLISELSGIERAIDQLDKDPQPPFEVKIDGRKIKGVLTPGMLVNSCGDLIQGFGEMLAQVLSEAGVDGDEVNACLTIGKLTHALPIRSLLQNFGVAAEPIPVEPAEIAGSVAAWTYLSGTDPRRQPRLIACNAHNVGLQSADEHVLLIPRLTALPASVQRKLQRSDTTFDAASESLQVTLVETLGTTDTVRLSERSSHAWTSFERYEIEANTGHEMPMDASIEMDEEGRVRFQVASRTVRRESSQSLGEAEVERLRSLM